ncbi:HDL278Cp [Eremothecium sinecaudum]|uniref:HDL278Cp n=1 Tax=Eremothecium sinecaudum TaxID=45286 RepID=A0A0X8HS62_9SACH|nr:HDL278Cp [Eremothecium sinecaudum]AMD20466.1 HDL278Cp [Eremothecium sinecaudum]
MFKPVLARPFVARSFSTTIKAAQDSRPLFDSSLFKAISNKAANPTAISNENSSSAPGGKVDLLSMLSPRDDALGSKLTGPMAGRTVAVFNGNTMRAFQRLNSIIRSNEIAEEKRQQRFYLKPGKAKEQQRSQKHRKEFMKGFKSLIEVVKDAKRKGY